MRGLRAAVFLAVAVSGAATVTITLLPQLDFEYRLPALHVAVETAAWLIATLACALVVGRFLRRHQLSELVLACALTVVSAATLVSLSVLLVTGRASNPVTAEATHAGRLFSAMFFAAAALAPDRRLRRPGLAAAAAAALTATVLLAGVAADVSVKNVIHELMLTPPNWARPHLAASPVLFAELLAAALLYGVAAIAFLTRSLRRGDEFLGWVALAAVLAAASRVNYFLYASPSWQSVSVGDGFRLAGYAALLIGSVREILSYWRAQTDAASVRERSRIAHDLHDGVAQDLAYLARNLDSLSGPTDPETVKRLCRAAERAQLESRRVIRALARPAANTAEVALAGAATEIAEQFNVGLDLNLAEGIRLSDARAEALLRIACEAVANAARHSGASRVSLTLERQGSRVLLRVNDTGRGFDSTAAGGGFGLISMHERARSAGGELHICSSVGGGSQVEAIL
jgi:signal transduction histidine kinase